MNESTDSSDERRLGVAFFLDSRCKDLDLSGTLGGGMGATESAAAMCGGGGEARGGKLVAPLVKSRVTATVPRR